VYSTQQKIDTSVAQTGPETSPGRWRAKGQLRAGYPEVEKRKRLRGRIDMSALTWDVGRATGGGETETHEDRKTYITYAKG